MDILTVNLLPRRLTKMYRDTKRSYEQIVQTDIINPQLSSLHLKLRVQKDRYVAWGLEWADSKADQTDDIDGSLDRAGISDLVASIMSSIKELIDEAERIEPQSRPRLPGGYPNEKRGIFANTLVPWTSASISRLEDIVKDLTISVDTLCDLSRSQQILRQQHSSLNEKKDPKFSPSPDTEKLQGSKTFAQQPPRITEQDFVSQDHSSLILSTRIDPDDLIYPTRPQLAAEQPPSYNSTATDPGNRAFAFLRTSWRPQSEGNVPHPDDTPVLVDFYSEDGTTPMEGRLPSLERYEDLVLALQGFPQASRHPYTGSLRLLGWFVDPQNSAFAFVYEVECSPPLAVSKSPSLASTPHSLLSYLQHSGDVDSNNMPCLEDRFRLALNLASNILHVHAKGITHRNINSNNIVFVRDRGYLGPEAKPWLEGVIRRPFLVSWDHTNEDTEANAVQQETLIPSLYRHPEIERGQRQRYRRHFDVYSLGLVLLEIGLWMPLNKLWKTKYTRSGFRSRLQSIYAKKLSSKCGKGYMGVVMHCLYAADIDQSPDRSSRRQHARTSTDFYWQVVKPLQKCCMLDDSDQPAITPVSGTLFRTPTDPITQPAQGGVERQVGESNPVESQRHISVGSDEPSEIHATAPTLEPVEAVQTDSPTQPGLKFDILIWSREVPSSTRAYFDTVMMPRLCRMFAKAINRWESYELDVFMAGDTPETAKPTLLMVCRSVLRAWKILQYVNQEKGLFDIQVASGHVTWSKRAKKKRTKKTAPKASDRAGLPSSRFQQRPSCGASIGCFVDEQHSEAVTFGGVVLLNGEAHGMSVHHMLIDPDAALGLHDNSKEAWPPNIGNCPELEADLHSLDISDEEFEDLHSTASEDADFDLGINMGDIPGTQPGEGDHIIVTQPALDDVDPDFFPDEDEMSDDHLVSHGLGNIHSSSGLRRRTFEEVPHEVDWALFKLHDDRKSFLNRVTGSEQHCQIADRASYPSQVLKADALGNLEVHAFGSTSGLATGKILPTMQMTKMPGRIMPSPVWRVKGNFGVGGDSGAWVLDNATGGVCGHVTAYSEFWQYATISPMEVIFHDMEQTLGAKVALPTTNVAKIQTFNEQFVAVKPGSDTQEVKTPTKSAFTTKGLDGAVDDIAHYDPTIESDFEVLDSSTAAQSPPFATSPPPPSSSYVSELSLSNVAEQWSRTQEKRSSVDGSGRGTVGKGGGMDGATCCVREGVQAKA